MQALWVRCGALVSIYSGRSDFRERAKPETPTTDLKEVKVRLGTKLRDLA